MKKTVGSLLVAALLLTGCGSNSSNSGLKVYHDYETQSREVTTFNYLSDFQATNAQVYANFVDGLVENDNKGQIIESLAKDYSANDTKDVWTFHLRDGLKWLRQDGSEYGDVTAQDFVTAVKYSLDAENGSNNTSTFFFAYSLSVIIELRSSNFWSIVLVFAVDAISRFTLPVSLSLYLT